MGLFDNTNYESCHFTILRTNSIGQVKRRKDGFNYSGTYSFVTNEDVQRSQILNQVEMD